MVSFSSSQSQDANSQGVSRSWLHWLGQQAETIRRGVILALLFLLPAMWILQPVITDSDIWWHVGTGKWIVEHGALPSTDPFSSYGEGKQWVAYSWLFEVGMYELVRGLGESAVIVYTLVCVWLSLLVILRIVVDRTPHFAMAAGLTGAAVIAMAPLYTPRPWLLTILFFAITLEVVLLLRDGKDSRWVWALPFVYVIWANVHIQFIYGIGLLGLACLAPMIDRYIQPLRGEHSVMVWGSRQWMKLCGLAIVCGLATLINPHHIRLYGIVAELLTQTGMWEYTDELQSPAFRTTPDWAMLFLLSLALFRMGRQRSSSSFEVIFMLVATVCAFRGARDVWFLVMATVAVCLTPKTNKDQMPDWHMARPIQLTTIGLIILGIVSIVGYREFSQEQVLANTAKVFPAKAVSFMQAGAISGPLFNHYDWGGYLIARLPHLKVSMDGRANVHGDERIKREWATWTGGPDWKDDPELNEAHVVIAKRDMALASLLRLDPRFNVAYEDDLAVVFSRSMQSIGHGPSPADPASPSSTADIAVTHRW